MRYRKALMSDAYALFNLKNDKDVINNAIVKGKIEYQDHLKWLKKNIQYITIVEMKNMFVGDVRVKDGEMSIRLLRDFRGMGMGHKIIKKFKRKGYTAKILVHNLGSLNLFIKNGFRFIDFTDGVYTLKYK